MPKIEKAFAVSIPDDTLVLKVFIGYRITTQNRVSLIYNNQDIMPDIRTGNEFTPGLHEQIVYEEI